MKNCALFILAALGVPGAMLASDYNFTQVNYPNDNFTQLLGINNSGVIAGYHGMNVNKGFTATLPANFTNENFPNSAQTQVVGINSAGNMVGFYVDNNNVTHGFSDVGGTFTNIDAPNTAFNQLLGNNDLGQIAGYSSTDPTGMTLQMAFVRQSNGTFNYLTTLLPAGIGNSQATDINNSDDISGFYQDASGEFHGFLDDNGVLSIFNAPIGGEMGTQILGLNNEGQFVGTYTDAAGNMHGFVDSNGNFQTLDDPLGVGTTTINGINDKGQVVGFFVDGNDATEGFEATPTPEPMTFAMAGLGVLAVGLLKRRAKK